MSGLKLTFEPYVLQLRHPFTIATQSRNETPIVLTQIQYEGVTGFGEASLPPYLGESHHSVVNFLNKIDLSAFPFPFSIEEIMQYVDSMAPGNNAAKASIDIALHDLTGKLNNFNWHQKWGYQPVETPCTSYTIGIDKPEMLKLKVMEASAFQILKVKLGKGNDRELIKTVRKATNKPLYADVNQGWKDKYMALDMIGWLKEMGILLIEQPLPCHQIDDLAWLTERSPLPVIADEGIQRLNDLKKYVSVYSGVNIKLMKSTGMHEAHQMVEYAKNSGMKVMIGCMTETSCAVAAASQLSPACDFADLDGPFLISNNPFPDPELVNGKIKIPETPGIGVPAKI